MDYLPYYDVVNTTMEHINFIDTDILHAWMLINISFHDNMGLVSHFASVLCGTEYKERLFSNTKGVVTINQIVLNMGDKLYAKSFFSFPMSSTPIDEMF